MAKAGAACGTTGGVEPALSRPWPSHSSNQTLPQAFPRQLLQLPAGLSKATLAATRPRQCFKPFRRSFQGNSRSFPQAFPRQLSQPTRPRQFRKPFQGNSRSYRPQPSVFKGIQDCRLAAFKPFKPFRRPFQGNSSSYTPQPSVFKRLKTAVCPPSNPSNPPFQGNSCSFPQAFPRQLSQLHAPDNASNPNRGGRRHQGASPFYMYVCVGVCVCVLIVYSVIYLRESTFETIVFYPLPGE